jgi:hypothetical protein
MQDLELAIKRLELVKQSLETETIDLKAALEIVVHHLIELCEAVQEKEADELVLPVWRFFIFPVRCIVSML